MRGGMKAIYLRVNMMEEGDQIDGGGVGGPGWVMSKEFGALVRAGQCCMCVKRCTLWEFCLVA